MNPQIILNQMLNKINCNGNPMLQNAIQMYNNNDVNGLRTLAENVAKQKGVDLNQLQQQLQSNFK